MYCAGFLHTCVQFNFNWYLSKSFIICMYHDLYLPVLNAGTTVVSDVQILISKYISLLLVSIYHTGPWLVLKRYLILDCKGWPFVCVDGFSDITMLVNIKNHLGPRRPG